MLIPCWRSRRLGSFTSRFFILSLLTFLLIILGNAGKARAATIIVAAGSDLQAALVQAEPGDTIELEAGASFTGSYTLPYKAGTNTEADWITIRTSAPDSALPAAGSRIDSSYSAVMAKIVAPTGDAAALRTAVGAHHYRMIGIEFKTADSVTLAYDLITLGDGSGAQNAVSMAAHHLMIDRCYIHGNPTQNIKRGIALNSGETWIINSYISDFKLVGQDSEAICGWNGPGPYHIINNYLEAAGENVLFGGADAVIMNLVPSDIEIRRNNFSKKLSWKTDDSTYAGTHWEIKNLLELKNARRVQVDGNTFENNWADGQNGYSVLFTVRNQSGGNPWASVDNVQFTNNILRHATNGFNILSVDDSFPSQTEHDIQIVNNLVYDLGGPQWNGGVAGAGNFAEFEGANEGALQIRHNTAYHVGRGLDIQSGATGINPVISDNIMHYHVIKDGSGGTKGLNGYAPGGWVFQKNVIMMDGASEVSFWTTYYPQGNYYVKRWEEVGFASPGKGDYRLRPDSPFKKKGTDGKDIGADLSRFNNPEPSPAHTAARP